MDLKLERKDGIPVVQGHMPQTTGLPTHSCLSPSPFLGKPTIIQPPSVLVAYVGQPGVFHCVAVGDPKPSIQWKNDSDVITTGGRLEVFVNGTLKIKGLLKSDVGRLFTCEAKNSYGSTSASASLQVNGTVYHLAVIVTGKSSISMGIALKCEIIAICIYAPSRFGKSLGEHTS